MGSVHACVDPRADPGNEHRAFSQGGSSRLQDYLRINDSKRESPAAAKSAETGARAKLSVPKARDPAGESRPPAGLGVQWSLSPALPCAGPSWAGGRNSMEETTHGDLDPPPEHSPGAPGRAVLRVGAPGSGGDTDFVLFGSPGDGSANKPRERARYRSLHLPRAHTGRLWAVI